MSLNIFKRGTDETEDAMTDATTATAVTTTATNTDPIETNTTTVELAEDQSPCAVCGVAVADHEQSDQPTIATRPLMIGGRPHPGGETTEATFATCTTCQTRQNAAESRARACRALVHTRGPHGARAALSAAYDVLAAIGAPTPGMDGQPEPDDAEVDALVRVLAPYVAAVRWSARWATGEVATGTAAASPFAGVDDSVLANVRRARGRVLAARVARTQPDMRITPPDGDGCLMCGVDAVVVSASRVAQEGSEHAVRIQAWCPLKAQPSVLGGHHSREALVGYTCRRCTAAIEEAGAIGMTAMEISLRNYWEATHRDDDAREVEVGRTVGVVAWASLRQNDIRAGRPPREPSRQPWDHMSPATSTTTTTGGHDE